MTAILLLLGVPLVMWLVQTVHLKHHGLPIRWRIDAGDAPSSVRGAGRLVTQASLLAVILVYPLLHGESILEYYARLLPPTATALQAVHGAAASALFLCVLYGAWLATGRVVVCVHQEKARWIRRLILLLPTAALGAAAEELLFRGVVMADLLHTQWLSTNAAVALAVGVFAAAHYVRSPKRRWTLFGHLMLGLLLCSAFYCTGTLWLAIGLHAGGILVIMGLRPFIIYRGPAWLTGASIFPFAGIVGGVGLAVLTNFVVTYYGGR